MEIVQTHAIITLDSTLKEIPRDWLRYIEPKIIRAGFLPCWIWTGTLNKRGLPIFVKDGQIIQARRFVMAIFYEFGDKAWVYATCDHKNCLNPAHLVVSPDHPRVWDRELKLA